MNPSVSTVAQRNHILHCPVSSVFIVGNHSVAWKLLQLRRFAVFQCGDFFLRRLYSVLFLGEVHCGIREGVFEHHSRTCHRVLELKVCAT